MATSRAPRRQWLSIAVAALFIGGLATPAAWSDDEKKAGTEKAIVDEKKADEKKADEGSLYAAEGSASKIGTGAALVAAIGAAVLAF